MIRLVLCVVLAACANARSEPTRGPVETALHHHRRGPVQTTARELFADFTQPDADGLVLLDKYRDGARFTATLKTVGVDDHGLPIGWIDVDGENVMALDFASPPPPGLRAGAQLTVTCTIGGASGALMMMTRCTGS